MKSAILEAIGIDPGIILGIMLLLIIILIIVVVNINMKYNRLKASYYAFMRGKDAKTMEESILEHFDDLDELAEYSAESRQEINDLAVDNLNNLRKIGIVKYDAFNEMGGSLSFALTLLDGNNNGCIINSMHSLEGCYNYIKEIVKGESYIELSEEEAESLNRAINNEKIAPAN